MKKPWLHSILFALCILAGFPASYAVDAVVDPCLVADTRIAQMAQAERTLRRLIAETSNIEYVPAKTGESARKLAERILGIQIPKPPVKEMKLMQGGFRMVFRYPDRPDKVIKVYDSILHKMSPEEVQKIIRREVALSKFLPTVGIEVAPIESDLNQLNHGIIIQEYIAGAPLDFSHLEKSGDADINRAIDSLYSNGNDWDAYRFASNNSPAVDEFIRLLRYYDPMIQREVSRDLLTDIDLVVPLDPRKSVLSGSGKYLSPTTQRTVVGIDPGTKFNNIRLRIINGKPILVDW